MFHWLSKTLLCSIPTFLMAMLSGYFTTAVRLRSWWRRLRRTSDVGRKVYDLAHCGPASQFMAGSLIVHNCGYGASARKVQRQLGLKGVSLSLEAVQAMHARYWELFGGIRRWERQLRRELEDRGGWINNGHGRPLAIPELRVKDLCNAFAQSTGHDCLLTLLHYIDKLRRERSIPMVPWMPDQHDETTWQVPVAYKDAAVQVIQDAYTQLNADLNSSVPIIGSVDVADNFWEFKT